MLIAGFMLCVCLCVEKEIVCWLEFAVNKSKCDFELSWVSFFYFKWKQEKAHDS